MAGRTGSSTTQAQNGARAPDAKDRTRTPDTEDRARTADAQYRAGAPDTEYGARTQDAPDAQDAARTCGTQKVGGADDGPESRTPSRSTVRSHSPLAQNASLERPHGSVSPRLRDALIGRPPAPPVRLRWRKSRFAARGPEKASR